MSDNNAEDGLPAAGVTTSGGSYRAMTTGSGETWLCPHVHFTQQSARTCADQRVKKLARGSRRPSTSPA